jgi:hypothetical protein
MNDFPFSFVENSTLLFRLKGKILKFPHIRSKWQMDMIAAAQSASQ